jgi:hypothetical protein
MNTPYHMHGSVYYNGMPFAVHYRNPQPAEITDATQRQFNCPCEYQATPCSYGDKCVLKGVPVDVCTDYARGKCLKGEMCQWKHDDATMHVILRKTRQKVVCLISSENHPTVVFDPSVRNLPRHYM